MNNKNDFTKEALNELTLSKEHLNEKMFMIQNIFRDFFKNENILISGRVKSEVSLKEKIIRKQYEKKYKSGNELTKNLNDIIGIRILCLLESNQTKLWNKIKEKNKEEKNKEFLFINKDEKKIYLENIELPVKQKNGHDIYKIHGFLEYKKERYNFELQIKSLIHMLWGEIEHMLFYKNYNYVIDNEFYRSIMDNLFVSLNNIDSQLERLWKKISSSERDSFLEFKNMFAKILHGKIYEKIESIFDSKININCCCYWIIDYLMVSKDIIEYKECLENISFFDNNINTIERCTLEESVKYNDSINKDLEEEKCEIINDFNSNLFEVIKEKTNVNFENGIFYKFIWCIKNKNQKTIQGIVDYFIKIYYYKDDIGDIENNETKEFLNKVIESYIIKIVKELSYNKLIMYKEYILDLIITTILNLQTIDVQDNSCDKEELKKAISMLKDILFIKTCHGVNIEIKNSDIINLDKNLDNDIWKPEIFNDNEYNSKDKDLQNKKIKEIIINNEVR